VVKVGAGDVLLVGADGIGDPLGSGDGGVGNLLRGVLAGAASPSPIGFAYVVGLSRETFDDDRILVAVWPSRPAPLRVSQLRPVASRPSGLRGL
jgi:hypothetical protein